tara:strand:+ start:203 stop:823 length:621 start_codon:yes stop_codon:yes gene_type:complete
MSIVTYNNRSIANISAIPGTAKSLTHIKTLTASSSATLSFVDGSDDVVLDSTYPIYLFKFISIHPSTNGGQLSFNMSTDSGSNYNVAKTSSVFQASHNESGSSTSLNYETGEDLAQGTGFQDFIVNIGNGNDENASGEMYLFNPSSTTFVKHYITHCATHHDSDYAVNYFCAGYGNTTSAVDGIQFKMHSGDIDAGTIKLYGLKDS